jgi:hypothetical protein
MRSRPIVDVVSSDAEPSNFAPKNELFSYSRVYSRILHVRLRIWPNFFGEHVFRPSSES